MATGLTGAQAALVGTSLQGAIPETVLTVFSANIIFEAMPILRWFQFAKLEQDLSKNKGDTIKMLRFAPIEHGGRLVEGVNIQPKTMDASEQSIVIDEYGNAVQVSERLLRTSQWSVLSTGAKLLGDDYAIILDEYARRSAMSAPATYFSNGKANRAALAAGDGVTAATIAKLVETAKVMKIPPMAIADDVTGFSDMVYVMFVSPAGYTTIQEENDWKEAVKYTAARRLFLGEVGMFKKTIFIETTMVPVIKPTSAGAVAGHVYVDNKDFSDTAVLPDALPVDGSPHPTLEVHVGLFFGDYLFGYAEGLPVEMRDNGIEDYGRKRSLAWYSIFGFGLLNPSHGIKVEYVTV